MDPSIRWFIVQAGLCLLGLWLGCVTGRNTKHHGLIGLILAVLLMGVWTWLVRHPAVGVQIIPVYILSQIEGTAAVPLFMFIMGIAWARSQKPRQRRLVTWATIFGVVYFLQGGMWMIQATPSVGFAETYDGTGARQSQNYSCVPTACVIALDIVGVSTTEAEMAQLVQARPGTGSTLLRAMQALSIQLAATDYQVQILQPTVEQLRHLPVPALTPMQFEPTRRHMVALTRTTPDGIWVTDPTNGIIFYTWDEFKPFYIGQVLVLTPRPRKLSPV